MRTWIVGLAVLVGVVFIIVALALRGARRAGSHLGGRRRRAHAEAAGDGFLLQNEWPSGSVVYWTCYVDDGSRDGQTVLTGARQQFVYTGGTPRNVHITRVVFPDGEQSSESEWDDASMPSPAPGYSGSGGLADAASSASSSASSGDNPQYVEESFSGYPSAY